MKFYSSFIAFYYLNFITTNSFTFFKKIFLNLNFLQLFNFKNNKNTHLYHYILFKKQNSLVKKKFNYLSSLHPIFYKKNLKKKINLNKSKFKNITMLKQKNLVNFNTNQSNYTSFLNVLNGKKKLKKSILMNRKLYRFLNYNLIKTSKKLNNNIYIRSKLKPMQNLTNLEYSFFNIALNTNFIKSHLDLLQLLKQGNIYLNRKSVKNYKKILNIGDILEFFLSYKMYKYIKGFKLNINKHILKIRNKIWFKLRLVNKNKLSYNKNNLINNVFKNNAIFKQNIPNYLEIDYYTLTAVLILKNFNINTINLNIKKMLIIYLFKLYNWK